MGRHVASSLIVLALAGGTVAAFTVGRVRPLLGLDLVGGVSVTLTAPPGTDQAVLDQTLEVIRERVDAFGVAEPDITRQGDLNILVQIPQFDEAQTGGENQERLLELIGKTARLEYRIVEQVLPPNDPAYAETQVTPPDAPDQVVKGPVVYYESAPEGPGTPAQQDPEGTLPKYKMGPVLMTGEALDDARAVFNDPAAATDPGSAGWVVSFRLTKGGRETFAKVTRENTQKQLAIVLDARVESAPTINEPITEGNGQISGNFSEREAKDLALVLRTGALPVELEPSEVRTVSATLGRESLDLGLTAGVAGLIALALYLAFYYRVLGVVTWVGMAIWAILSLGIISFLGRTVGYSLTLAGVAGLVVSIGVAADSYVVFYERLKDEVRHGKTLRVAVGPAFKSAWRTIVAANMVTIAAAIILYLVAVGSVRGFALTLGLATFLDLFVVYFFKRPTVFLIARSRRLSEMKGMGLRSGVAADPEPAAAGGGR
jgi:protein-export membrane protein SecD